MNKNGFTTDGANKKKGDNHFQERGVPFETKIMKINS